MGGIHLEMVGEDITECLSDFPNVSISDLNVSYKSPIDPRLNEKQALDLILAFMSTCFEGLK